MTDAINTLDGWLNQFVHWVNTVAPERTMLSSDFMVLAMIAIVLVSLVAGSVGSLVVSNRMAFFSDALAHCAFAGVACGLLVALIFDIQDEEFRHWLTLIRVCFGVAFGLLIAYVHEKSSLPSD